MFPSYERLLFSFLLVPCLRQLVAHPVGRTHLGSPAGLVIRNRTGSAWELEIIALVRAHSLEGDARTRGLLEGTIRITKPVRELIMAEIRL